MQAHDRQTRQGPPRLRRRAIVFGASLLLFGVAMLLTGLGIGLTKSGLPPEQHPSLLIGTEDLPAIRARVDAEPYRQWRQRLLEYADVDSALYPPNGMESDDALRAKALAFAHVLTKERRYASRATEILARARPPSRSGAWGGLDDIVESAAAYAIAYDLLAGYLRAQPVIDKKTRLLLSDLGRELHVSRYRWPSPADDTRRIRQHAALGLCALAIRDFEPRAGRAGPKAWYSRATRGVLDGLARQVCDDGAYAEGPERFAEAAELYIPFLIAGHRVTGDYMFEKHALRACEWAVKIRQPNGLRPNIDCAALTPNFSYALTADLNAPGLFRWDAGNSALATDVPAEQLAEALAWYDSELTGTAPDWPASMRLTDSGDTVFRSNWGPDSDYLYLRAERAQARTAGGVFEQPDATSFILCHGDETLVLDSGYGGWKHRDATRDGPAHSIVLMDGEGPPVKTALGAVLSVDVDVETCDSVFDEDVSAVRVRRRHDRALFDRTVIFAGGRDFIVFDNARAAEGEHEFTWLLHVNAGGTTGGGLQVEGNRALIRRPGAAMNVELLSSAKETALTHSGALHYFQEDDAQSHMVLRADVPGSRGAHFVALLSPRDPGKPFASATPTYGKNSRGFIFADGRRAIFRTGSGRYIGREGISTNGVALYWVVDRAGRPEHILVLGASKLWIDGKAVWKSDQRESHLWRPKTPVTMASSN